VTTMELGEILDRVESAGWPDAVADVSVIVATHNRCEYLPELVEALAAQTTNVEVVIADDGSTDRTWQQLTELAATVDVPFLALRLAHTGGPSRPRNTAAAHARTAVLAITDDDCLPEPGWAATLAVGVAGGAGLVQGLTRPVDGAHGPWDRTVNVAEPSGLFETCNLGVPRDLYLELAGFPTYSVLADLPRGFGEDVVFGARAARARGFRWAPDAVVRHRWIPTTYAGHLDGVRRLAGFPWLAREVPEVPALLTAGVFLSRRTLTFDVAVVAVVAAAASPWPWVGVGAAPWAVSRVRSARHRARGRGPAVVVKRFAQLAAADAVGLAALLRGSLRHRRPVL
jgi:hypothetical protein